MTHRKLRVLLVVCARKGSKRLKGKHHLLIAGREVWEWVVRASVGVRDLLPRKTRVVISTDDKKIINWEGGGEAEAEVNVIPRRPSLSGAGASIHLALQDALQHVFDWLPDGMVAPLLNTFLASKYPEAYDAIVCLPANVPTVTPKIILECIKALEQNPSATAAMTVRPVRDQPEWLWTRGKNGILKRWSRSARFRVQDFPERFHATGTCCAVRTKVLMACRSSAAFAWLGKKVIGVLDPDAIEIHDEHDYKLAKAVLEAKA